MRKPIRSYQIVRLILPIIYGITLAAGIIGQSFIIIIALMGTALIAGAFFCGWLCPFGAVQEWSGRLGRLFRLPLIKIPGKVEKWLRLSRYILLALAFTGLAFTLFITSPYGSFTGVMLGNISRITTAAWILLGAVILSSLVIERPFCRYMCTEGARYGIISLARLFSIRRNEKTCISCGACDRKCPTQVKISEKKHIRNFQCINCFECISACPVKNTLTYGPVFQKKGAKND